MINQDEVKKMAELSRIKMSDGELTELQGDLDKILDYVSTIQSAPTDDIPDAILPEHRNVMREDENPHDVGEFTEALLANVSEREGDYVKVKKVL